MSSLIADHRKFVEYANKYFPPGSEQKINNHTELVRALANLHYWHNKSLGGSSRESTCQCICGTCHKAIRDFLKHLQVTLLNRGDWNFSSFERGFTMESKIPITLVYECGCETCSNPGDEHMKYVTQTIKEVDCEGNKCRVSYRDGYGIHCTACYGDYRNCTIDNANRPRENDSPYTYYIQQGKILDTKNLSFTCNGNKCRLNGCKACSA